MGNQTWNEANSLFWIKHYRDKVAAFESGEIYVRMRKEHREELAFQDIADTESTKQPDNRLGNLTIEGLLDRMDAIRREMLFMNELLSTMENITNQGGEDDAGHIAEATSQAFIARETTCQQQLRFLEKIYNDHFSAPSEEAKTARTRMILDNMNDVIPALDYSDENGNGSIEALKALKELYSDLLK